jgi:putative tryptophan/tyrosine transport system substrate-binding protein
MKRREFITLLGGAAVAWPLEGRAQQRERMRRIAWFGLGRADVPSPYLDALRSGLRERGWIEGNNLTISMYWTTGQDMDAVAHILAASSPEVIVTQELTIYAVRSVNTQAVVVFGVSGDPVEAKFVESLARPGGNLTGMSYLAFDLVGKRIELLKEWVPQVRHIAVLARPQHPGEHRERQATQEVIDKLDMLLSYFPTPDLTKMDEVFRAVLEARCEALVVFPDAAMFAVSDQIARFASQAKLPSVSGWGSFARNGLLLTYGPNVPEIYRSLARYVDRILRGTKAAELPVELPTRFELVINLRTAKALRLEVPPTLIARADEVIE